MKKTVLASLLAASAFGANAASLDGLSISGFGSVGVGKSDNNIGYAKYTDEKVDWEQETLAGLQFDFQINDRAKFVTQIVANSRYDYEPKIEMAYASYDFDHFTARAGKLRLPLFFYSDYIDLGYAYPMIRPSQETYENIVLKGYTGADLLIPVEFENSSLLLQPVMGIATIDEDDSRIGEVKLDQMFGLSANWNYEDLTLRASYFIAEANPECDASDLSTTQCQKAALVGIHGQDGQFVSLGMQYDNGDFLANVEGTDVQLDGKYSDTQSVSGLFGYRIGEFTPYLAASWVETTDNEERPEPSLALAATDPTAYAQTLGLNRLMNYERMSYSVGTRWDFYTNMAFKFDVTFADYQETSGGFQSNIDQTGAFNEQDSVVYSARLDFVF
ncbi:Forms passive diffusion pores that allow small molecular weight hydrophilic materials across the outer membrane [Vibrio sp. B1FLJ16]|uniref:hypothetical protein n=1 Tax=Vibrio sp. B1FLJ16 TaxID=2751178 RepID=UPI0015F5A707|nr:hypothetical protein [Vibrio sp. B1FLJ16]CAD7796835.1 Forms passive diffusion pores that allow small molecular weight hydrophilic materials across the outer membrane [Vibrio sp. B1FLJ16]CAE6878486.1 Forms passive diffusion pores that allow small molecular weight hydrophilic materials across the outer membrane [Vibrio sp. B1FLJ16]